MALFLSKEGSLLPLLLTFITFLGTFSADKAFFYVKYIDSIAIHFLVLLQF